MSVKIKSIKKIDYVGKVYDLSFDKDHIFGAACNIDIDFKNVKISSKKAILVHNSAPDIDVDYMTDTDYVVDEFLHNKYGKERVLPVATFSTFNEKGCLKDVVRAHRGQEATGFDSDVFQVTKEMPNFDKVEYDLKSWFQNWPKDPNCSEIAKNFLTNPNNYEILNQTLKLQGQIRGIGQHAAGVVITPSSCWEYIPTNIISKNKKVVTAFQEADKSGKDLSELGILKLDRLKLETINIIMDSIEMIKKNHNIDIKNELDFIDINNRELYEELRLGMNHGIFQFESPGMNALIRGIQVENFNELVAANALYRPGPMGIGAHEEYIKNKFDKNNVKYIHPSLEPILRETNGVMIYQEQLMFIADKIGGTGLGAGDSLRRYMDKAAKIIAKEAAGEELTEKEKNDKSYQGFRKYWDKFLDGAESNGYKKDEVDTLKGWIIKYLGYSFNKSHSLSYSYLALQTLYLKRYYPLEFYCSLLNHPKSSGDKDEQKKWLSSAIYSAVSKGIKISAPSLKSGKFWSITGEREISMGLSSIDGFGDAAYDELIEIANKKGKPIHEFTKEEFFSQNFSKFNKTSFESCLKAGVFDKFSNSRNYLVALKEGKKGSKSKVSERQLSMWDLSSFDTIPSVDESLYQPTSEELKKIEFIEVCNFDLDEILSVSEIRKKIEEKHGLIENVLNFSSNGRYYFVVKEIKVNNTKRGNGIYLRLKVGDGLSHEYINMFDPLASKYANFFKRDGVYVASFVKNDKGFMNFQPKSQIIEA